MDELYTFERELAGDALPFCGPDGARWRDRCAPRR